MDKFWLWMKEKEYADKGELNEEGIPYVASYVYKPYHDAEEIMFTDQMIMGYIIEYLIEKHIRWSIDEGTPFEYWRNILERYVNGKTSQSWDDERHVEIPEK